MVKNHHRMIERAAFSDFRPDGVILFDISGDSRRKFEPLTLPLKILMTSNWFIEEGGISDSLARKGTKLFETCRLVRVWKGASRVEHETRRLFPVLPAPSPSLIPVIKPFMIQGDDFLSHTRAVAQALDQADCRSQSALHWPEGSKSQQMRRSAGSW